MSGVVVQVLGAVNGVATRHDDEFVVSWNPHTIFGCCDIETTPDKKRARVFANISEVFSELRTVSNVQPRRPTDGKPNRPLTGLHVMIEGVP